MPTPEVALGFRDRASGNRAGRRALRVLQFAYGTSLYGAERWVLSLIKHLDRSRIETVVGCILDDGIPTRPLIEEARHLGFETLLIDGQRWTVVTAARGLRAAIRERAIDLVHSHGTRQDMVTLLARWRTGRPIVSTPHGWDWRGSLKVRCSDTLNKALFLCFDAVAPLSDGLSSSLRLAPIRPSKLHLIPNGVDLEEIEAVAPLSGLLPGQASTDDFVIGYLGQLIPRKGVDVLLRALAQLDPSGWCCLVLGDGPCRSRLERQARALGLQERVRFLGFRPDRLRFLKRLDLLVLPSYREGIPRALMEGLAAGVPCVGSSIPGVRELLEDGSSGTTFPAGDARRLAQVLRSHLLRPQRDGHLIAGGRARVREQFSATAMARAYESLYEQLCHAT